MALDQGKGEVELGFPRPDACWDWEAVWLQCRDGGSSLEWMGAVPVQQRLVSCPEENSVTERVGKLFPG